ncbi:hypothetical protein ACFFLS_03395 [Flavobacterium procerum]|uniref:Uncharacterized protein n=1 Tax=Flavobacterium procerum TaxID=1455569 RepID=A0ABV6BKV0_9FLAO
MIFELKLLITDLFFAFSIFTILFLILSIFIKNDFLRKLDQETTYFISFIGLVYLLLLFIGKLIEFNTANDGNRLFVEEELFGKYWYIFWFEPLIWVLMTQLLWIKKVRKNVFIRLFFSALFIVTIEHIIDIAVFFTNDYLPSSWRIKSSTFIYPSNLFLEILVKVVLLLFFVGIYFLINRLIKKSKAAV